LETPYKDVPILTEEAGELGFLFGREAGADDDKLGWVAIVQQDLLSALAGWNCSTGDWRTGMSCWVSATWWRSCRFSSAMTNASASCELALAHVSDFLKHPETVITPLGPGSFISRYG
jgi:hypothetical protein